MNKDAVMNDLVEHLRTQCVEVGPGLSEVKLSEIETFAGGKIPAEYRTLLSKVTPVKAPSGLHCLLVGV